MDGRRLLIRNLPEDVPHVGMEENTAEILASLDMLLMVYWGAAGDAARGRKWYDRMALWGDAGGITALRAQSAGYMVHYLGAKDPDGALEVYRGFFGAEGRGPGGTAFAVEACKAAVNLLGVMADARRADECLRIFRLMYERPSFHRNPDVSSRAVLLTVDALASRGRIEEALSVFRLVPDLGPTMEVRTMHTRAAVTLIHYCGLYGTERDARQIYDYILSFPEQRDSWPTRSRTAAAMASVYELKGNLPGAQEIFRAMRGGRGSLPEDLDRAEAAHSVIRLMGRNGDGHGALEAFLALGPWGSDSEEMDVQRAGALVNLVPVLGKAGLLRKARDLYAAMPGWGSSAEMDLMRAKVAVNLVAALEEAGEARKAQAVWDAMGAWDDQPELCCEKAKAAVTLIGLFGRLGEPRKAQAVFDALPQGEISPAFQELQESCLLNLLPALAMARRGTEALEAATGPAAGLLSPGRREELLKRLDLLMTRTESMGGKERRKVMRFLAEKIRKR
jgi:thioredoxin-like negative regulator of GroEL